MTVLGLTSAEARTRLEASPPRPPPRGSRSYRDIVWSNTFTVFNLILGSLLVLVLVFGDPRDALFGGVIVANTAIGIFQEVRAKRTLDRLSLLAAPKAHAWRDGELAELPVDQVVVGDALHLEPGDQVVADGRVIAARTLSLDESILTGESDQVAKGEGDEVLSGAYCAAGAGDYEVEHVGADSFAERIASEARGTRALLSPLQRDINTVLKITVAAMVPLAIALVVALALQDRGITDSVEQGRRRPGAAGARGPGAADEPDLRRRGRAAGAAGHARPAPELGREPGERGHVLLRQDRHAHRQPHPARGASRRRRATRRTRPASCWGRWRRARARATAPARRSPRASPPRRGPSPPRCRSRPRASGAPCSSTARARWCSAPPTCSPAPA